MQDSIRNQLKYSISYLGKTKKIGFSLKSLKILNYQVKDLKNNEYLVKYKVHMLGFHANRDSFMGFARVPRDEGKILEYMKRSQDCLREDFDLKYSERLWYFWDPNRKSCKLSEKDISTVKIIFRGLVKSTETNSTVISKKNITILMSKDLHDPDISESELIIFEKSLRNLNNRNIFNKLKFLLEADFKRINSNLFSGAYSIIARIYFDLGIDHLEISRSNDYRRIELVKDNIKINIILFLTEKKDLNFYVHNKNSELNEIFSGASVIIYKGHSGFGSMWSYQDLATLTSLGNLKLIALFSCFSYNYYNSETIDSKVSTIYLGNEVIDPYGSNVLTLVKVLDDSENLTAISFKKKLFIDNKKNIFIFKSKSSKSYKM